MRKMSLAASVVVCAGATGVHAQSQEHISGFLQSLEVYDCQAGEENRLLAFREMGADKIVLIGDEAASVRETDGGFSVLLADGTRDVSEGAYHIYKDGTVESGSCSVVTDLVARAYPTLTEGFLPNSADPNASPVELAAAVRLQETDLELEQALASVADARAKFAKLESEFDDTAQARMAAEAVNAKLTAELEQEKLEAAASASAVEALEAKLNESESTLAAEVLVRVATVANLEKTKVTLEERTTDLSDITAKLSDLEVRAEDMAALLAAKNAELAKLRADAANLRDHSTALTSANHELTTRLSSTAIALDDAEQSRRVVVATVATLNQQVSELIGNLRTARNSIEVAEEKAVAASAQTDAMGNLANAAMARVATLQGRSVSAVRNEICTLVKGSRPSECR